ncbi:MAG: hypothetical protein ACN2B6_11710 [Rickettsiales bacterium]
MKQLKPITLIIMFISTLFLAACEKEGTFEKAGDKMDEAVNDTRNAVEDVCEDVKQGVGAADSDC